MVDVVMSDVVIVVGLLVGFIYVYFCFKEDVLKKFIE